MHGLGLRSAIENLQQLVIEKGKPVVVDNQGTIEILNHSFSISYTSLIDIDDIKKNMNAYYHQHKLNLNEIEELEAQEYSKIEKTIVDKFIMFDTDIHSRRVLWTDDCCISMIHYLVRDNKINCYVHLRSSDVENKLFSDLFLVHKITRQLQEKLGIYNTLIYVTGDSMHKLIFDDMNVCNG